jgi:MtN3 and saliva related transmembrane protein
MDKTQIIGIASGVLTSISMLPQVIKILKEKKAEEISLLMISVLLLGLAGWAVYGFMKNDLPIIVTNCFSVLVNVILLFLRLKYSNTK